jgi:hypothetical protein
VRPTLLSRGYIGTPKIDHSSVGPSVSWRLRFKMSKKRAEIALAQACVNMGHLPRAPRAAALPTRDSDVTGGAATRKSGLPSPFWTDYFRPEKEKGAQKIEDEKEGINKVEKSRPTWHTGPCSLSSPASPPSSSPVQPGLRKRWLLCLSSSFHSPPRPLQRQESARGRDICHRVA